MRRDDDYIRELLLEFEESEQPFLAANLTMNPAPADLKRHMHAVWLADAG